MKAVKWWGIWPRVIKWHVRSQSKKQIASECKSTIKPNNELGAGDVAELVMCLLGWTQSPGLDS